VDQVLNGLLFHVTSRGDESMVSYVPRQKRVGTESNNDTTSDDKESKIPLEGDEGQMIDGFLIGLLSPVRTRTEQSRSSQCRGLKLRPK
jgi:hypothetical protein